MLRDVDWGRSKKCSEIELNWNWEVQDQDLDLY